MGARAGPQGGLLSGADPALSLACARPFCSQGWCQPRADTGSWGQGGTQGGLTPGGLQARVPGIGLGCAHRPKLASPKSSCSLGCGADGREPPITHGLLRTLPQHKDRCNNREVGSGLRPPTTHGPAPDGLHPTPSLLGGGESLTQLPEELHPQGGVDEEQQHEEEAQVAHLWGQRWGWAGRAGWRRGAGRQAPGEGPAEGRVGSAVALCQALSPCLPPASRPPRGQAGPAQGTG